MKSLLITISLILTWGLNSVENRKLLLEYAQNSERFITYNLVGESDDCYLQAENGHGEISLLFISQEAEEVRGYQSKSKIILQVTKEKIIQDAQLIRSKDTPSFVKRIKRSNFFQQFVGWKGKSEIKAVTGATITCNAVENTIANMLERINKITLTSDKVSEP